MPCPLKILIIEDDMMVALNVAESVAAAGFEVVGVAAEAEDGLWLAEQRRPDIAIVDVKLRGEIDGLTVGRELATNYNVSVIFATACDDAVVRQGLEIARSILPKPYTSEDIIAELKLVAA